MFRASKRPERVIAPPPVRFQEGEEPSSPDTPTPVDAATPLESSTCTSSADGIATVESSPLASSCFEPASTGVAAPEKTKAKRRKRKGKANKKLAALFSRVADDFALVSPDVAWQNLFLPAPDDQSSLNTGCCFLCGNEGSDSPSPKEEQSLTCWICEFHQKLNAVNSHYICEECKTLVGPSGTLQQLNDATAASTQACAISTPPSSLITSSCGGEAMFLVHGDTISFGTATAVWFAGTLPTNVDAAERVGFDIAEVKGIPPPHGLCSFHLTGLTGCFGCCFEGRGSACLGCHSPGSVMLAVDLELAHRCESSDKAPGEFDRLWRQCEPVLTDLYTSPGALGERARVAAGLLSSLDAGRLVHRVLLAAQVRLTHTAAEMAAHARAVGNGTLTEEAFVDALLASHAQLMCAAEAVADVVSADEMQPSSLVDLHKGLFFEMVLGGQCVGDLVEALQAKESGLNAGRRLSAVVDDCEGAWQSFGVRSPNGALLPSTVLADGGGDGIVSLDEVLHVHTCDKAAAEDKEAPLGYGICSVCGLLHHLPVDVLMSLSNVADAGASAPTRGEDTRPLDELLDFINTPSSQGGRRRAKTKGGASTTFSHNGTPKGDPAKAKGASTAGRENTGRESVPRKDVRPPHSAGPAADPAPEGALPRDTGQEDVPREGVRPRPDAALDPAPETVPPPSPPPLSLPPASGGAALRVKGSHGGRPRSPAEDRARLNFEEVDDGTLASCDEVDEEVEAFRRKLEASSSPTGDKIRFAFADALLSKIGTLPPPPRLPACDVS